MLSLKCSVCLEILKSLECRPMAAPCGHIYCQSCLDSMLRIRQRTNCAFCRQAFPITAVVKLFVEYEERQLAPAPPLTVLQKEAGERFLESCAHLDDNAEEEETLQMVVSAEKVVMDIDETHGSTDAERLLKLIHVSLEEFRKRLKLFSRINALQQRSVELEQARDSLRQAVVGQLREADEAAQVNAKLERRLKKMYAELETYRSREHQEQEAKSQVMREMKAELQAQRATSNKYKKKYYVISQKLKKVNRREDPRNPTGPLTSETDFSDDSLEITISAQSQKHSNAVMKASLKRQITSGCSMAGPCDDLEGTRKTAAEDGQGSGSKRKKIKPLRSPTLGKQESYT